MRIFRATVVSGGGGGGGAVDSVNGATGVVTLTATLPITFSGTNVSTNMATARLIGRTTGASGVMEELSVVGPLALDTGTLTTSMATARVLGRTTASTGVAEELSVVGPIALGTGTITTSMATAKILGRTTASTGVAEELSVVGPLALGSGTLTTSMTTARLLGRTTASTGVAEEISVTSPLALSGGALSVGAIGIGQGGTGQTTQTAAFNALSPLTTKGDLLTMNATDDVRVGVGTNNYILRAQSSASVGIEWSSIMQAEQAIASTITWTGTTAPSGTTNLSYWWGRMGNYATLVVRGTYSTAGTALTVVTIDKPTDVPSAVTPATYTNNDITYPGYGALSTNFTDNGAAARGCYMTYTGSVHKFSVQSASGSYKAFFGAWTYLCS